MGPFNRVAAGAWLRACFSFCQNLVSPFIFPFIPLSFHLRLMFLGFLKQVTLAVLIKPGVIASSMTSALKHWGEDGKILFKWPHPLNNIPRKKPLILILIFQFPFISFSKNMAQRKITHEALIKKTLLTFSRAGWSMGQIKGKDWRRGSDNSTCEYTRYLVSPGTIHKHRLEQIQILKLFE